MSGEIDEARRLMNLGNRTVPKLRQRFYQSKIAALEETSSNDWWKQMKNLVGAPSSNTNEMQGLANKCTEGDMTQLVNSMNDFFMSVSADLHRFDPTHRSFDQQSSRLKLPLQKGRYRKWNVGKQPDRTTFLRGWWTILCTPVSDARHGYFQYLAQRRQASRSMENW